MKLNEIYFSGAESTENDGFVIKDILRTGVWKVIPTNMGLVKKPLTVIREGKSDPINGVISMQEVVDNFKAGALDRVQIPLSDDNKDHKNITKLNTGFVRDLWIEDEGEVSKLKAKMEFTEPDVKEKVLRGTYADVSCGIPWELTSRGKTWGPVLEHVCITNRPFIDGLGPFLAASDTMEVGEDEVGHYADEDADISEFEVKPQGKYIIFDHVNGYVTSTNSLTEVANLTWNNSPEYKAGGGVTIKFAPEEVKPVEEPAPDAHDEEKREPVVPVDTDPLRAAQRVREARINSHNPMKETNMSISLEDFQGLELSDTQKAALASVLEENSKLKAKTRESMAEQRIAELKELGLEERPGALKFYRQVFLSDDEGPAAVLLSDEGGIERKMTATEILDEFITTLKGKDEKVTLSDQDLLDDPLKNRKPPENAGEEKPLAERIAETKAALGV